MCVVTVFFGNSQASELTIKPFGDDDIRFLRGACKNPGQGSPAALPCTPRQSAFFSLTAHYSGNPDPARTQGHRAVRGFGDRRYRQHCSKRL